MQADQQSRSNCNPGSNAANLCIEKLLSVSIRTKIEVIIISVMNEGKSTSITGSPEINRARVLSLEYHFSCGVVL